MNDKEVIRDLLARERMYRVTDQMDKMEECYFPDAVVTTSWTTGTVPVGQYLHGGKVPKHDPECPMLNRSPYPIVYVNGTRAYAEVPQTTHRWTYIKGVKAILTTYMRLIYFLEKRDDQWRITDFRSIYESDALAPEIPGQEIELDLEKLAGLRHSYRYLAYVDGGVDPDLPGIDRPESVKAIYDMCEEWLGVRNQNLQTTSTVIA